MARKLKDPRYAVQQEHTGHVSGKPQWVLRFDHQWVNKYKSQRAAWDAAAAHKAARDRLATAEADVSDNLGRLQEKFS